MLFVPNKKNDNLAEQIKIEEEKKEAERLRNLIPGTPETPETKDEKVDEQPAARAVRPSMFRRMSMAVGKRMSMTFSSSTITPVEDKSVKEGGNSNALGISAAQMAELLVIADAEAKKHEELKKKQSLVDLEMEIQEIDEEESKQIGDSNNELNGEEDDVEPAPDMSNLAERRRQKRKQMALEEEEKVVLTKEQRMQAKKEAKKQQPSTRVNRLASIHAIPDMSDVVVEKEHVPTVEEILAEQKEADLAKLAELDAKREEKDEFLRKLRGEGEHADDGSEDSNGREITDKVVDTIDGSMLFKFERYFIYLNSSSLSCQLTLHGL